MVTWSDVQATMGRPLTSAEIYQSTLWIGQARSIIGARLGSLEALDQGILDMIVTEAVANRLKRPDSATQVSVSVDDGQVSRTYESSTGQIEILPQWWALLSPTTTTGAFSVRPHYEVPDAG